MATPADRTSQPAAASPSARASSPPSVEELPEPLRLHFPLRDFEKFPVASLVKKANPSQYRRCCEAMQAGKEFNEEHVLPYAEAWDMKAGEDHMFVPWDAIKAGSRAGFFSTLGPAVLGGLGYGSLETSLLMEEWAVGDAGLAVVFGAHGLALAGVVASQEPRVLLRLLQEVGQGDMDGDPCILALAYTEVGGGSDVEDVDDIKVAKISSRYERVPGGYRVNARKVFISNGSFAKYQLLIAYEDPKRPLETAAGFLIPSDSPGLSVGRVEHKLGQRTCPAAEIVAEDVFVPEGNAFAQPHAGRMIDTVLTITRGPVGAIGAGVARGALERTLKYVAQKRVGGHWLFEEQWVKLALADMAAQVQAARGLYVDAALAFDHFGMGLQLGSVQGGPNMPLPGFIRNSSWLPKLAGNPAVLRAMRKQYEMQVPKKTLQRVVAHASTAKFLNGDGAVNACMKAMEILGEDANDPQWGVEKCLRDAKLTQIFEGTNQINRLHVARGFFEQE